MDLLADLRHRPRYDAAPYFVIDRHNFGYLDAIENANCLYCSYATGVVGCVREVATAPEQYWRPMGHLRPLRTAHARYRHFFGDGDAAGYRHGLERLKRRLRPR